MKFSTSTDKMASYMKNLAHKERVCTETLQSMKFKLSRLRSGNLSLSKARINCRITCHLVADFTDY